ncbi:disulfide bond formation protein B [Marinomonas epiphytica]
MLALISARRFHGFVAFVAFALLAVAFYMEYQMGLEPCPLCMMQRIAFFVVGVFSLISAVFDYVKVRRACAWAAALFAALGAALAIRHLYLQNLPADELPACLPGLSYMFEVFPWQEILESMIMGTGECGETVWTFLGLSIPGWTLVAFTGMTICNFMIAVKTKIVTG